MLFNSYLFIFIFLPVCLSGYYMLIHWKKQEAAKLFLIAMSFWFYGYFHVGYLLIMAGSILVNYLFHRILSCFAGDAHRGLQSKGVLFAAVAVNLGILFYFKYLDFFIANLNAATGSVYLLRHIVLPLGISFFTFQQIGFVVDTYRGGIRHCRPLDYVLFVSFFPQLTAGPIVSQEEMLPQFAGMQERKFDWEKFSRSFLLFVLGLFKKVILADTLGAGVDFGYDNLEILGRMDAVIVIVAYSLQLYFDFSGYCDMARGIGGMFGLEIPVNFNSPYRAVNIIDFWKRWHITLNRFFMRYVYIPLGGNRKGRVRMYGNLLAVFFLSGLWHGAGWNYIVWGMLHGVLYVITRWRQEHSPKDVGKGKKTIMTFVSRILLFCYVSIAWVYFRAENIAQAGVLLTTAAGGRMQRLSMDLAECFQLDELWYVLKVLHLDAMSFSRYILMFVMLAGCLYLAMSGRNAVQAAGKSKGKTVSALLTGAVFVWCVLSFSQVSTFLYFNF